MRRLTALANEHGVLCPAAALDPLPRVRDRFTYCWTVAAKGLQGPDGRCSLRVHWTRHVLPPTRSPSTLQARSDVLDCWTAVSSASQNPARLRMPTYWRVALCALSLSLFFSAARRMPVLGCISIGDDGLCSY